MKKDEPILRKELIAAAKLTQELGLVVANEGNVSCRLSNGSILISASGRRLGQLSSGDLVEIDPEVIGHKGLSASSRRSTPSSPAPSSELRMHLAIYEKRPDVQAIIHAHPLFATLFASSTQEFPLSLTAEGVIVLQRVAYIPFKPPGTEELAQEVGKAFADPLVQAALLANHGAVSVGSTPEQALCRMEVLENLARMAWAAALMQAEIQRVPSEYVRNMMEKLAK